MANISSNIIGSGFLAKYFRKHNLFLKQNNLILYVSGVSNSLLKDKKKYNKDFNKVKKIKRTIKKNKFIYISSCAIFDPARNSSRYIKNKVRIEKYIKKNFDNYKIIRLPELVGKSNNKSTLTNFFYNKIKKKQIINIFKNTKRNILDVEDAVKLVIFFLKAKFKTNEINISNIYFYTPLKLVKTFEKLLNIKSEYVLLKKKKIFWKIKNFINKNTLKKNNIKINKDYLNKTIIKYYSK